MKNIVSFDQLHRALVFYIPLCQRPYSKLNANKHVRDVHSALYSIGSQSAKYI